MFAFKQDNETQTLIHYLKYKGFNKLGVFLGELLSKELVKEFQTELETFEYLIPVPLYAAKVRERGYNQSDYICRGMNDLLKKKYCYDLVNRIKNTKSQTKLKSRERIENVKDAFELNHKYSPIIQHKNIIVVDDVITSGSTINEVISTLKKNKAGKIFSVSLATASF